jgi:RimJ/RimL family protein N-acetyltransferase
VPGNLLTSRMLLRRLAAEDLEWLAELHGDPMVMRYIDDGRPVPREVVAAQTMPAVLREYEELPTGVGRYAAVDLAAGSPLGWFGLRPPSSVGLESGALGQLELGYRLLRRAWGRGYAAEGARALVDRAFRELGAERVVATTMTVNTASRRVLEKAGMSLVRTFFADWPEYIEGAEHGDVVYRVTRQDWLARR